MSRAAEGRGATIARRASLTQWYPEKGEPG